ncbi:uncharacterized protein K460DRAFT_280001, partial [Cucurbitaria berberidis CBS 394.84]
MYVADILHAKFEGLGVHTPAGNRLIEYDALSYSWGSEETPQILVCNGVEISIGENLSAALRSIRNFEGKDKYLWVDAICIDQSANEERGKQVSNMFIIYQKAAKVIAWIDSADE